VLLVVINTVWAVTRKHSGPVIASLCYAVVALLCWRKSHFQAGVIVGFCGSVIHIIELVFQGVGSLGAMYQGIFYANIVFPILLIYFSYKAHREIGREAT
jgi:hypothetical protein